MFQKYINEELKDIIVSGYTEKEENRYIFNLMKWWVYLKFDHYYVVLNSNNGNITFEEQEDIICKFDIEVNPEKPDVPLNKNDAFQKIQKRRVQEKR